MEENNCVICESKAHYQDENQDYYCKGCASNHIRKIEKLKETNKYLKKFKEKNSLDENNN